MTTEPLYVERGKAYWELRGLRICADPGHRPDSGCVWVHQEHPSSGANLTRAEVAALIDVLKAAVAWPPAVVEQAELFG